MKTKSRIEIELEQDFNEFKRSLEQDINEPDLADKLKAEVMALGRPGKAEFDKLLAIYDLKVKTVLNEENCESESNTELVLTQEQIAELQGIFD